DVMRGIFHDFSNPKADPLLRDAQSEEIDAADLPLVRKILAERLESMMERLAEELNSPRWQRSPSTGRKVRLGAVGMIIEEVLAKEPEDERYDKAEDFEPKKEPRRRSRNKSRKVGAR